MLALAAAIMVLLMAPLWPHAGPVTAAAARLGREGAVDGLWMYHQQVRGLNSPSSDGQHRGQRSRQLKGAASLAPAPAEGASRLHSLQNSLDVFLDSIRVLIVGDAAGGRPIPIQIGQWTDVCRIVHAL